MFFGDFIIIIMCLSFFFPTGYGARAFQKIQKIIHKIYYFFFFKLWLVFFGSINFVCDFLLDYFTHIPLKKNKTNLSPSRFLFFFNHFGNLLTPTQIPNLNKIH